MNGYKNQFSSWLSLTVLLSCKVKKSSTGEFKSMLVASQNLNVPSVDTVAFGLGYMVNLGCSEAEGVGMEFCQDIIAELI